MGSAGRLVGSPWIWKDGEFIRWDDAQVHVLSLAVQFAASVFEGVRCYETARGPAVFRLDAHLKRLMASSRTYRMQPDHTIDELTEAVCATIRKNELRSCYIRPMVLRGYGAASMRPDLSPIETYIPVWPWGAYLGEEGLAKGVDVCVSSWNRPAPNTVPSGAKSAGNYLVSTLMVMEASSHGYVEAIGLGPSGLVSEGSGQNLFMVVDGEVVTPILDGTSLSGITRHSVLKISEELGYTVREQLVPREMLYAADELFFTGTASEVTPIRSVDGLEVGNGRRGPVTERIQTRYLELANGEGPDPWGWVTYL
ncbi:MAG: branched-chain amino acid transaminase [Gemmatimonadota bacterium]|nr:branched-chain amino acid transaminase [Gemmatimonadota bacterium]